ncbi:isopenicillin N synthase family dioxygenase [Pseudothauera rhizosphaerae]|uniref:2-oxoglutarate-dependent ethylene/succinate-forming enzyme n=1 Tax=Pseudothauera rhizosphaerae TaxID=2565932 RepID=A0A4S4AXK0_9RHOO|nr:2-oxoglutarate and iron-dependent oxygenase domain-containing protein [Pseudothauera rhizosphaerae]THF63332.1 isopenicillin N synthase family oxygenase [Pseudothauera rhizosphaerae]
MSNAFPILDLRRFDSDRAGFLADLREAARTDGFFYLVGHGVPDELITTVFSQSRAFFDLPEAAKLGIEMIHSPHFRGYTRTGREITRGKPDWREQIDFGAERPALRLQAGDPAWRRLQGPNQWPTELPELRPAIETWQALGVGIAHKLLRAFAVALEQPEDVFDASFLPDPTQQLKIIRYPGQGQGGGQGCGAHKDSCFVTLLWVEREPGLQVERDGRWIDAPPIPGAFVVNIGEALELASNGYLRATVHRVLSPPAGRDRLSVAFFPGPRLGVTIPLLQLPDALAWQATGPESDPHNPLFYNAGDNALKGRLRSHPDVAARYYADVHAPTGEPASAY